MLQAVIEVFVELGFHSLKEPFKRPPNPWLAAFGYAIFGAALGAASLFLFPEHFMPSGTWRLANLIATPIAAGLLMAAFGAWRARRGQAVFRIDRFSYGYLFALSLALVRYQFAN
nr:hypothetical protein [Luteimonas galliterrae]